MNILLVDPPSSTGRAHESSGRNKLPSPNMGLIYLATYIKAKAGNDANIKIIDPQLFDFSPANIAGLVAGFKPDLVGISAKTFNVPGGYYFAKCVKEASPGAVVVLGGAHATALPEQTLEECPQLDALVLREGELTMWDIVSRLSDAKRDPAAIFDGMPGCAWRGAHGQAVINAPRELIADLDSLPFPDFSFVDYSKYAKLYNPTKYAFQHIYPVFGSRGCPFNCTFCMPLLTRKHRVRSVGNIIEEVKQLNRNYGARRIYFEDSLFCPEKSWFEDFCQSYIRAGLHKKVQWGFETRIDVIKPELFKFAKEAGCIYTFFGAESGSERVLSKANKRYSRDSIIAKVYAAKAAGISQVNVSIIFGLPYETRETIKETLSLLEIIPCDNAGVNILDVYPGTEIANMVEKGEGGLRWAEGFEMAWGNLSRTSVTVEVNDVTAQDLLAARDAAIRIVTNRAKKGTFARLMKMAMYSKEMLRDDPKTFVNYVKDALAGKR